MVTLETWWSPAAQCWRIEDGEMFTFDRLDQAVDHLRQRRAAALISPPPHGPKMAAHDRALRDAGIEVVYGAH